MNIEIRHSEPEDIAAIKDIYAEPSCYSGTLQLPYPSLDQWQQQLLKKPVGFYSLVAWAEGLIVAQLGLQVMPSPRRKHAANMGMAVKQSYRGQGVGHALLKQAIDMADNWLNLNRLELEVYTDNKAAIQLYKKHGFVTEGLAQAYAFRAGEYVDVILMARLRLS